MYYQFIADAVTMPCCIISVERSSKKVRIAYANDAYKRRMGGRYHDNMPYEELVPQNNRFEEYCYQAAIDQKWVHTYVEVKALHCWIDFALIPLAKIDEEVGYCQYVFETTTEAEYERMDPVSTDIAQEIIISCISLMGAENFNDSIQFVLADILDISEGEHSRIILMDEEKKKVEIFSEFVRQDLAPDISKDMIYYDLVKTWENSFINDNMLVLLSQKDMDRLSKDNPIWVESMKEAKIHNMMMAPLRRQDKAYGYLYVVNFNEKKATEVNEYIELMSFFLSSEISNNLLMDKLSRISNIDALTGLNNRRAMIQRTKYLNECRGQMGYGLISLDLNGLKYVNDNDGHDAGDELLIKAGNFLKNFFNEHDIYRMGGDEFIVIVTDLEREAFEDKVYEMRKQMAKNNEVNFATGVFWCDGTCDSNSALRFADTKMYEDKKAYYDLHPDKKRK